MRNFFVDHKGLVLLIAATLILAIVIGIFAALAASEGATFIEQAVEGVAEPGQAAVQKSGNWFVNLFSYFGGVKALREENQALKNENVELDKRLRDARGLETENAQLREMLDLTKTEHELELLAASVIAKNPSNWYGTFTIGKGSDDGIQEGQAVLTEKKELVGKISRVGSDWAEVVTLLDPECGVGAMVLRTKDVGVAEGDSSLRLSGKCKLGYLSRDAELERDDYVETSGMGGVYPKGLLIGRVLEIKEDNTNMSKYAIVEPMVNFGKLQQVFVLLNAVEVIARSEEDPLMEEEPEEEDEEETSTPTATRPAATATARPTATPKPSATVRPSSTPKPSSVSGQELRE
ncbi:MAG: rod shape-determining protein MreC [Clostridia bacterium]|nr:rod shape-determining protein MreC [Clostridia bacterium]